MGGNMRVRAYMEEEDRQFVEELERECEAGPSNGRFSIFTDTLGDPLSRIRHYPLHTMLVAEIRGDSSSAWQIVGVVRAGLKHVVYATIDGNPVYAFTAYILGLRVSPYHRRKGIGMELVKSIEKWSAEQGVEYAYMASDQDNHASINLFTGKLGYSKFRTPAILLQPVYVGAMRVPAHVRVVSLSAVEAEALYRSTFGATEFFPSDIGTVLRSPLTAGTWAAYYSDEKSTTNDNGDNNNNNKSWAVLSVWRCNRIFRLHVRGAPWWACVLVKMNRGLGHVFAPCMAIPTFPDVFSCPFGAQVLYGAYASGPRGGELLRVLCAHAHNQARAEGCELLATELGAAARDPATLIPHWKRLSRTLQDVWCIKRLEGNHNNNNNNNNSNNNNNNNNRTNPISLDWCKLPPTSTSLFVDPRDF